MNSSYYSQYGFIDAFLAEELSILIINILVGIIYIITGFIILHKRESTIKFIRFSSGYWLFTSFIIQIGLLIVIYRKDTSMTTAGNQNIPFLGMNLGALAISIIFGLLALYNERFGDIVIGMFSGYLFWFTFGSFFPSPIINLPVGFILSLILLNGMFFHKEDGFVTACIWTGSFLFVEGFNIISISTLLFQKSTPSCILAHIVTIIFKMVIFTVFKVKYNKSKAKPKNNKLKHYPV
ncbi:hypothetical protein K502DRAFT_351788 [Neoconidiobolus thromboides FSU 785]|nr:hypothetical protein K502DRAFT_351788 [Neoconidiobolus thromboides FSU 785]